MTTNLEIPQRALAIGAHPDDVEFGCGGTLAKWANAGCEIIHVICTNGSKGTWDSLQDPAELAVIRQDEQRAAARALGGKGEVVFLGWPDGELASGLRERLQIASVVRRFTPDVVLGHDPWKRYRLHPDHRNAGFLVTDGVVAARDPLFFPELGLKHHRPATILLFEADEPDHVEDVTTSFDQKLSALYAHQSQLETTMHIADDTTGTASGDQADFEERLRTRMREVGEPHQFVFAEAFKRIDDR